MQKSTQKTKNFITLFFLSITAALFFFCIFIYLSYAYIKPFNPTFDTTLGGQIVYNIQTERIGGSHVSISGVAFNPDASTGIFNSHFILKDTRDGSFYRLFTQMIKHPDVPEEWLTNYGDNPIIYRNNGMKAVINVNKLTSPLNYYTIFILYENDGLFEFIDTGIRLPD